MVQARVGYSSGSMAPVHPQPAEARNRALDAYSYNRRRRQRRLGQLTPVEFELAFAKTTAQADA